MAMKTRERTGRVIALAAGFFGGLAALGVAAGTFARLDAATLAGLALFAAGFAVLTYAMDANVRTAIDGAVRRATASLRKAPAKSPRAKPAAT